MDEKLQRFPQTRLTLICRECKEEFKGQQEADAHMEKNKGHDQFYPKPANVVPAVATR